MPQLRPGYLGSQLGHQPATKMVTRQSVAAAGPRPPPAPAPMPPPPPVQAPPPPQQILPPLAPEQAMPAAAVGPNASWIRTSQRPRRSNVGAGQPQSRENNSPTNEPSQEDTNMMAAGGPSLYGQFHHRTRASR